MKQVSVIYHSGYGRTTNQARGIASGVENVTANLIVIDQDGEITGSDWHTPGSQEQRLSAIC